ncbi:hypothetical protein EQZ23_10980 [Sphingomonas sp. UV9]|uniref:head completion/stabilization protein n=1 Tax=Sphingomonas sp. UV9 TaxID=1851410 RepID=UPI000FFBD72B|nr:head completion/stabilization protein [Sphingomonas sp. UV9]RXD05573.1 hypothetical protein EQZ23_10980 [Sphingomonas sp. UV9]
MSMVAVPPVATPPAVPDIIPGDAWYPELSIAAFKISQRMPAVVTDGRAREALLGGILSADVELSEWRSAQEDAGVTSLATAIVRNRAGRPLPAIGGEPRAIVLWRRAVHAYASADLAATHHDISATADGRPRNEDNADRAPDLLRTATLAIRDMLGRARSRSRLL